MNLMTGGAHGHLRYGPGDLVLAGVSAVRPILTGRPFIFSQAAAATREIPKGPGKWTPDHGQTPQSWKNYHNDHGETEPCGGFIEKRRRVAGALLVEALDGMGYCRLCCWIKDEPFPAPEGFIRIHGALTTVDVANIVAVGIGLTPNILRALLLALLLSVNGAKVAFHIDVHCSFAIAIKGIQWLSNGVTNALALNAAGSVCGWDSIVTWFTLGDRWKYTVPRPRITSSLPCTEVRADANLSSTNVEDSPTTKPSIASAIHCTSRLTAASCAIWFGFENTTASGWIASTPNFGGWRQTAIQGLTLHTISDASVLDPHAHRRLTRFGVSVEEAVITWRSIWMGGVVALAIPRCTNTHLLTTIC